MKEEQIEQALLYLVEEIALIRSRDPEEDGFESINRFMSHEIKDILHNENRNLTGR